MATYLKFKNKIPFYFAILIIINISNYNCHQKNQLNQPEIHNNIQNHDQTYNRNTNNINFNRFLTSSSECNHTNCAVCSKDNNNICYQCKQINSFIKNGICTSMCTDFNCERCEQDIRDNQIKCVKCINGYTLYASGSPCKFKINIDKY